MTEEQVIELMESSKSEKEWNANCDEVKQACGGYPDFWYQTIILTGMHKKVAARWGGDASIKIQEL